MGSTTDHFQLLLIQIGEDQTPMRAVPAGVIAKSGLANTENSLAYHYFFPKPRSYFSGWFCLTDGVARIFFIFRTPMPRPGIELMAEFHLLEGPFKGALPTVLHGRGD